MRVSPFPNASIKEAGGCLRRDAPCVQVLPNRKLPPECAEAPLPHPAYWLSNANPDCRVPIANQIRT